MEPVNQSKQINSNNQKGMLQNGQKNHQNYNQNLQQQSFQMQKQQINKMIIENQQLLTQIYLQSKTRKNKNMLNHRMSILINKLQRNLIKISRAIPPESMADYQHVERQKQRFIRYYKKRNNTNNKK